MKTSKLNLFIYTLDVLGTISGQGVQMKIFYEIHDSGAGRAIDRVRRQYIHPGQHIRSGGALAGIG